MTAKKKDDRPTVKFKLVLGASLPQRLSKDDRDILLSLKPSIKMQALLDKLPPLKIVDEASCGF